MSPTVNISSAGEFIYADWCGPCKAIAPTYESLSTKLSKPNRITFTKINVDHQQQISQRYGVRAMPTFLIFRSGSVIETIQGADVRKLTNAIESAVKLGGVDKAAFSSAGRTLSGGPARGHALHRSLDLKKLLDSLICFIGLYLISLFSFDPYAAAENSQFNIHRVADTRSKAKTPSGTAASNTGTERKVGTIADITGGN